MDREAARPAAGGTLHARGPRLLVLLGQDRPPAAGAVAGVANADARPLVDAHARGPAGGGSGVGSAPAAAVVTAAFVIAASIVVVVAAGVAAGAGGGGLVDMDLVGEGVRVAGGDRGYVVLVGVDAGHELHDGRREGLLHGVADLGTFWMQDKGSVSTYQ